MRTALLPIARSGWIERRLSSAAAFLLALVLSGLVLTGVARASCGDGWPDPRCVPEFERFAAVTVSGDQFLALGKLKAPPQGWAILKLSSDGQRRALVNLPTFTDEHGVEVTGLELTKIMPLRDGAVAIVGSARPAGASFSAAFAALLGADGRIRWQKIFPLKDRHTQFQSGWFDAAAGALVVAPYYRRRRQWSVPALVAGTVGAVGRGRRHAHQIPGARQGRGRSGGSGRPL